MTTLRPPEHNWLSLPLLIAAAWTLPVVVVVRWLRG